MKIQGDNATIKVYDEQGIATIAVDPTYAGQYSICRLGTITEGNWHAAVIAPAFGGTGIDNGEYTITLGGNLATRGNIILLGFDDTILTLPKSGVMVNREQTLDPKANLSDVENKGAAYDNIVPVAAKGDIVVFDGDSSWPLTVGKDGEWLAVNPISPLGINWKPLPSNYAYISNGDQYFKQRQELAFIGAGLVVEDCPKVECTLVSVHPILSELVEALIQADPPFTRGRGFLHYNVEQDEPFSLKTIGYSDTILVDIVGERYIPRINETYPGQDSIKIVGRIKEGKWEAEPIAPDFGGTGFKNVYKIWLGGPLTTGCQVVIGNGLTEETSVDFKVQGDTSVTLPTKGTLATEDESLQGRHNLGDLHNITEAFRNISPTKTRGDLIARGYGDYDVRVPIGDLGDVLTVSPESPAGMLWRPIEDAMRPIVESVVKDSLTTHTKAESMRLTELANQTHMMGEMKMQEVVTALLIQFDFMMHQNTGQICNELKDVLRKWSSAITKPKK